jgi:hypothetical protein
MDTENVAPRRYEMKARIIQYKFLKYPLVACIKIIQCGGEGTWKMAVH